LNKNETFIKSIIIRIVGIGDGIAKCPFDPEDNSTAIWVETGNPGGHAAIYSGTNAEFTKADTVIFRGDIFDANTGNFQIWLWFHYPILNNVQKVNPTL
jgi:hypothetical protein